MPVAQHLTDSVAVQHTGHSVWVYGRLEVYEAPAVCTLTGSHLEVTGSFEQW